MGCIIGGVVMEFIFRAEVGFIIITGASVLFALATKVRTMVVSNGQYPKDLKHKRKSDWV